MAKISSFENLEAGATTFITPRGNDHYTDGNQDPPPTQAVASGFSQINTKFHRLFNTLIGAPKDTHQLRQKLLDTGSHITQMVNDTSSKLKQASNAASKKIADAKLSKDFESVPKEFQKAQRELQYDSFVPQSSYTSSEHERNSDSNPDQGTALIGSRRQDLLQLNSEIVLHEAIIAEREQGIQEIQKQIGEVNGSFKELAVLVHEQGHSIDNIGSQVDKSYTSTDCLLLVKTQKSNSSLMCLLLVIFGIVLLIVIIVVTA